MKERVKWIESIRFIACIMVAWSHYSINYGYLIFWSLAARSKLANIILCGFHAVWATVLFTILLGFFAAKKAHGKDSFMKYTISRYVQFSSGIVIAEVVMLLFAFIFFVFSIENGVSNRLVGINFSQFSDVSALAKSVVEDILFLGCTFYETMWCLKPFFIGSLLCFALEKLKVKSAVLIPFIVLCRFVESYLYVGLTVLGLLLYRIIQKEEERQSIKKWLQKPFVLCLLVALTILFFQGTGSHYNDIFCYGISAFCFLLFCFHCKTAQKILSWPMLASFGKLSFGVYLMHVPVYRGIIYLLYPVFQKMPSPISGVVMTIAYFSITLGAAWVFTKWGDWVLKKLNEKVLDKASISASLH